MQQDRQGFIWLALQDGMLARFDGTRFEHFAMNHEERQIFGGNSLLNLKIDAENRFLVSIQKQLALFNPATGRFSKPQAGPNPLVAPSDFFELPAARKWELETFQLLENPKRLLRRADGAIFKLNDATLIYDVIETGNEIWVAAFEGLYKITPRKRWFETPISQEFDLETGPITGMSCYGIVESGGWLWFIGDKGLQRTPLSNPGQVETLFPGEVLGGTYQLAIDKDGWLWPGRFSTQIVRIDSRISPPYFPINTEKFRSIPLPADAALPEVHSFLQMPDGKIWVAMAGGILEVDLQSAQTQTILPGQLSGVWHLFQDATGVVWAGTELGLFRLSQTKGSWAITDHFHPDNCKGFAAAKILSINASDGFLWLGSDAGLIRFNPQAIGQPNVQPQLARTFSMADGLPHSKVYFALPEGRYLWCGTDRGLARVSIESALKNEGLLALHSFHVSDGLPHEEFNTLAFFKSPSNGKIYLGGLNGLTIFDPKDIENHAFSSPPLRIKGYEKYDRRLDSILQFSLLEQEAQNPIVLEYFDQFFTLHFALLSYSNPEQNRYRYRMEGYEKNWIEAGNNNFARYTALPPGEYTFRVQAADYNGNWSPLEIALPVVVKQAWFRSWWAWMLYALLASVVLYLIYRQRLRRAQLAAELQLEHARTSHLEEMDRFKSRLFTNISHEFRTPLTVILGTSDQLNTQENSWTAERLKHGLSMIKRNGENLLRLINQILDLAKLEEGKSLKINYVQGDVLAYIRYVAESLHSYANAQNVLLQVEAGEAKIVMDFAPEQLLSIVHNLLSNAIKFTPSGGKVTLRADFLKEEKSPKLLITVRDTGQGIPATELPLIFDRFYQANTSENSQVGGTGIGLTLTKELIKAMGGEIQVESVVGQGSVFRVELPVRQEAELQDPLHAWGGSLEDAPEFKLPAGQLSQGARLLLIEDNPDVVTYLVACLGDRYALDFAYNGRAGIEKALETVPDLLICDVMMPEKDGFEVCDFLKNDERSSHIPLILLTAKVDIASRLAGLRRGADAYLAKPFHAEELQVTVHNLLESRRKLQEKYREMGWNTRSPEAISTPDPEDVFLKKIRDYIESNLSNATLNPEDICRKIGMGHTNLNLKMNALTGMPVTQYIRSLRLMRAKELLISSTMNISEVAYEVGFNDPKYFSRVFSEVFGLAPMEWRKAVSSAQE